MNADRKENTIKGIIDFFKVLAAIITSTAMVGSAVVWFTLPRITLWLSSVSQEAVESYVNQSENNTKTLGEITKQIKAVVTQLDQIRSDPQYVRDTVLKFEQLGNQITDARVGERVRITWRFIKLHECGAPMVNVFFRNGDDITHRFDDPSVTNGNNEGVDFPANPDLVQTVTYSAVIPRFEDVRPGLARGWVTLRYPRCPWAPPSISPEVSFKILPSI